VVETQWPRFERIAAVSSEAMRRQPPLVVGLAFSRYLRISSRGRGGMRCIKCGSQNPDTKRFCGDCGAALANRCTRCNAENPPEKRFCGDCGAALVDVVPANAPKASASRSTAAAIRLTGERADASTATDGERKTVTALFADIKGSMELIEDLDPEEARAIVDPALKLMMDAVHRYGGYVAQSTGDGIYGSCDIRASLRFVRAATFQVTRPGTRLPNIPASGISVTNPTIATTTTITVTP
jgi:hypothetical protein